MIARCRILIWTGLGSEAALNFSLDLARRLPPRQQHARYSIPLGLAVGIGTRNNVRSYHRVHVELRRKDGRQIAEMLRKGQESARVLRRASILRQLDGGQRVAENAGVAPKTVRAIARRY